MIRQKMFFLLVVTSSVLFFGSGCNLFISLLDQNTPPVAISCSDYIIYLNETARLDGSDA